MKDIGKHSKNGKTISKDNFLPVKKHTEGPDRFEGRGLDGDLNIHTDIGTLIKSKSQFSNLRNDGTYILKLYQEVTFSPSKKLIKN